MPQRRSKTGQAKPCCTPCNTNLPREATPLTRSCLNELRPSQEREGRRGGSMIALTVTIAGMRASISMSDLGDRTMPRGWLAADFLQSL